MTLESREDSCQTVHIGITVLAVHENIHHHIEAVLEPVEYVDKKKPHRPPNHWVNCMHYSNRHTAHQHQEEDDEDGACHSHVPSSGGQSLAHVRGLASAESKVTTLKKF